MNWCQLTNLPKYLKESYFAGTRLANKLFGAISQRQIFVWWFLLIACQNILQKGVRANLKSHFNLESQGFTLLFLNMCWASFGTWHFGKKHFGTDICVSIDVSGLCMFWLRRHVAQGCYGTGKFWCSNIVVPWMFWHGDIMAKGNFGMGIFPHCWRFGTGMFQHLNPFVETSTVGPS